MKEMNKAVRVRFAPSPTGYLHIGGLRTALFNWLFARHYQGTFVVRIEDTDTERSKDEYTRAILQDLAWVNITSDEPIVYQSKRFDHYTNLIEQLIAQGKAYKDYYTQDEMSALYAAKTGSYEFVKAYAVCRDQDQDQKKPYVVRFKLPFEHKKSVTFHDHIRGEVSFDLSELDDFVIARSDGRAMYNFVVVADDIEQRITHIIRGEDHISNTPKQILLYEALGHTAPEFAHLPLILGKSGQPLSKRDAATAVEEYRKLGYLPHALLNYLARLGWAHGDQEIFSMQELVQLFTIDAVGKKGAVFDTEKLDWLNGVYIRATTNDQLYDMMEALSLDFGKSCYTREQLLALISLCKERSKTLIELAANIRALVYKPSAYSIDVYGQLLNEKTILMFKEVISRLNALQLFTVNEIKQVITAYAHEQHQKLAEIAQPIRIALVASSSSPSVFELLEIMGKKDSLDRIQTFVDLLIAQRSV